MLRDVVNPPEQLSTEDIASPLSVQLFELCDPDLLREALESPEVNSGLNYCYEENSPYPSNLPHDSNANNLPNSPIEKYGTMPKTTTKTTTTTTNMPNAGVATATTRTNMNNNHLSVLFESPEEIENNISGSIDFSPSVPFSLPPYLVNQQDQFDLSSIQSQNGFPHFPSEPILPLMGTHQLPSCFEDECLSIMPSYTVRLNANSSTSSSFIEPNTGSYLPSNLSTTFSAADNSRIFNGNLYMGNEMHIQELEYQGDSGGIFCPDGIFQSGDLQALSNESQHVMNGVGSSTPLASEVSSLEDSAFKGTTKLSAEERKERIHRYMKKRSERNFSKKIKYACRKTLADSRPRVRGRFAKNDELGEMSRGGCSNHEEDTDEDSIRVVKEEEELIDSSDIFAHISGVNSFKCSYPIQSWI